MPNIYLVIALLLSILFGGYEHFAYKQYRTEVQAAAEKQQAVNDYKVKTEQLLTKKVENDYKSKIDAIRATYGMHDTRSNNLSTIPNTAISIDDPIAIRVFIEQAAETTQQLKSLQDWITLQAGI